MIAGYAGLLYGRRVYITPQIRAMRPSKEFERLQDPKLVAETDRWMANFFGYKETFPDDKVLFNDLAGTIHVNAATYRKLRDRTDCFVVRGVGL